MDNQEIVKAAEEIANTFKDGKLNFEDVPTVIKAGTKLAQIPGLSNQDKKDLAVKLICRVIDVTDTPWLPDAWSDPFMKKFVPPAIDMLVGASRGDFKLLHE